MLSRVANAIYWMNRYIERAENYARFIDVNRSLSLDLPTDTGAQWEPLVMTTGDHELFRTHFDEATQDNVTYFLACDPNNPNSILSCLLNARENARSVREIISSEMWEQVNRYYLGVREAISVGEASRNPHRFFAEIKQGSQLFVGITDATMSHGEGWHFGRLGRLLERADKTSRILDVKYFFLLPSAADIGTSLDTVQWAALLKSASAFEMYRKRHGRIEPPQVVEFLMRSSDFPRAVYYSLIKAADSLQAITGGDAAWHQSPAEKRLGRLRAELAYGDVTEILARGLHEFLDDFQIKLNDVGTAVTETFFLQRPIAMTVPQDVQ